MTASPRAFVVAPATAPFTKGINENTAAAVRPRIDGVPVVTSGVEFRHSIAEQAALLDLAWVACFTTFEGVPTGTAVTFAFDSAAVGPAPDGATPPVATATRPAGSGE